MKRAITLAIAVVAGVAIMGCGEKTNQTVVQCNVNSDCPSGYQCVSNKCVQQTAVTKYSCSGTSCISDSNGTFTTSTCDNICPLSGQFTPDANTLVLLHLNEGSGTTTADSSGRGYNGTLMSSPTWVAGKYSNALRFSSSLNQYVNFGKPIPDGTPEGTVECWIKPSVTLGSGTSGFQYFVGDDTGNRCVLFYNAGQVVFAKNWTLVVKEVRYSTTLLSGTWYHIKGTWGSGGMKLYINDVLQASNTDTSAYQSAGFDSLLGKQSYYYPSGLYDGIIDEVRISNIAR